MTPVTQLETAEIRVLIASYNRMRRRINDNNAARERLESLKDSDRIKSEMLGSGLGKTRWPSRPGQQQYEWEQPRVVGNASLKRCKQDSTLRDKQQASRSDQVSGNSGSSTNRGQTKPCMGGTANGTSDRVDRLRLLGNGVVPDTCELAFKTLIKQLR